MSALNAPPRSKSERASKTALKLLVKALKKSPSEVSIDGYSENMDGSGYSQYSQSSLDESEENDIDQTCDNTHNVPEMNTVSDMIVGYKRFRAGVYTRQHSIYRDLGYGSQTPKVLVISCVDSRADPSTIFDAGPGQLFVVRNIANLVHPYDPYTGGANATSSGLEYAVKALKVEHVVVMGHGGCGGINASLQSAEPDNKIGEFEFVGPWVSVLNKARDKVRASNSFNPQYALELEGINMSIQNLLTFPFVKEAVDAGTLQLHGAWFAIHHGELHWRNNTTCQFEVVPAFTKEAMQAKASQARRLVRDSIQKSPSALF